MWLIRHILAFATLGSVLQLNVCPQQRQKSTVSLVLQSINWTSWSGKITLISQKQGECLSEFTPELTQIATHRILWFSMFQLLIQFGRTLGISSDSEIMQLSRRHFWIYVKTLDNNREMEFFFSVWLCSCRSLHIPISHTLLNWKLEKNVPKESSHLKWISQDPQRTLPTPNVD